MWYLFDALGFGFVTLFRRHDLVGWQNQHRGVNSVAAHSLAVPSHLDSVSSRIGYPSQTLPVSEL
jgi:hypothetical protein